MRDRVLDRLCFTVPLGEIYGPVESEGSGTSSWLRRE